MANKKVTRYRSKTTGRYISKKQWLRNRRNAVRARERYVKGTRRAGGKLRQLLDTAGQRPVIVRRHYKTKKMRRAVRLEITYLGTKITQVKVGHNTYTAQKDFEQLSALINASTKD